MGAKSCCELSDSSKKAAIKERNKKTEKFKKKRNANLKGKPYSEVEQLRLSDELA